MAKGIPLEELMGGLKFILCFSEINTLEREEGKCRCPKAISKSGFSLAVIIEQFCC